MQLKELYTTNRETLARLLHCEEEHPLLAKLLELGMPTKKSEAYRYFDIEKLLDYPYTYDTPIPQTPKTSPCIKIIDGVVVGAPDDMTITYEASEAIDLSHFDPLYYLSHLLAPSIIKIEIEGDREVEIEHHFTKHDALINYRIVLSNQPGSHVTLYENFEGEKSEHALVLYGYDLMISRDSTLRLLKLQTMQAQHYAIIASHRVRVATQAQAIIKSFDLGGDQGLQLLKVTLDERAHIDAKHLLYLNSQAKRGTISQIIHQGEHATSNQEAKSILDGDARGIFDALIKVEQSAKYAKAIQNSKAILLTDHAYMVAKPQLEIYIDELEASHGATTGQLDKQQLFYLQSRGISYHEARNMLVIAFANTLIETLHNGYYQDRIRQAFDALFYHTKPNDERS